jgi:hypothetical protein
MRTVKTSSGATAVQVVWSSRRGSREIEHLGSAHDEAELEALKAAAQQRIAARQLELDLGLEPASGGPLPITSSRMGHLLDALEHGYRLLGLEDTACGDEMLRHLVLARIIESASKVDSVRVLAGHREVHGRPQAARRHRRRGRRHDLRGQPVSREWNGGTRTPHGRSRTKRTISSLSLKSSGASPSITSRSATADCLIALLFRVMNNRE